MQTDIEIIAASTLPANKGSAGVLRKLGLDLVVQDSDEDWGYDKPLPECLGLRRGFNFQVNRIKSWEDER